MQLSTQEFTALLPLLITSATSVVVMLGIAFRRNHRMNATLAVIGLNAAMFSTLLAGLVAPTVVTPLFIVDYYACFYMALILATTLACATLSHAYMEGYQGNREELYLLLTLAAAGGLVLACAHTLAALFIGVELLSVPVYGMVAYAFREKRSLEAGIKYMVLSATASAFLLFGIALLYSQAGTLSFSGLGHVLASTSVNEPIVLAGGALILVGLGFKLSLAPFHLWTPDVYEGAPAPVSAFLATASKTAIFAVLLRFLNESPLSHSDLLMKALGAISIASVIIGNLLALTQNNLKRLLGYSSIAHFGYLLIAIIAGPSGNEAVGIYLLTYVVTTLAAFGVVTLMSSPHRGPDADALFDYRGLFWRRPYLTAVMTVAMLSLAGIPMTAGFIGKFYVVLVGVDTEQWWLLATLILGSALGLYYYLRVMVTLFLSSPGMSRYNAPLDWGQRTGGVMIYLLVGLMLLLGVFPQPFMQIVRAAGLAGP